MGMTLCEAKCHLKGVCFQMGTLCVVFSDGCIVCCVSSCS